MHATAISDSRGQTRMGVPAELKSLRNAGHLVFKFPSVEHSDPKDNFFNLLLGELALWIFFCLNCLTGQLLVGSSHSAGPLLAGNNVG